MYMISLNLVQKRVYVTCNDNVRLRSTHDWKVPLLEEGIATTNCISFYMNILSRGSSKWLLLLGSMHILCHTLEKLV